MLWEGSSWRAVRRSGITVSPKALNKIPFLLLQDLIFPLSRIAEQLTSLELERSRAYAPWENELSKKAGAQVA